MPPAPRTDTLLGSIRAYFGLPQWQLAGLLLVDEAVYRELEAGRRRLNVSHKTRILPLLMVLPAPPPPGPEPPLPDVLPPLPAPDPARLTPSARKPLEARLDYCRHHAVRLRRAARPYAARARYAARWAAALPTLRTAAPYATDPAAQAWLAGLPVALEPYELAAWAALEARAAGLEAEAAALAAWVEGGGPERGG